MTIANVLLYRWKGGFGSVEDAASIAALGQRYEDYVELGNIEDEFEAERLARSILDYAKVPRTSYAVDPVFRSTDDEPYTGFEVGDFVYANAGGGNAQLRTNSITGAIDQLGDPVFGIELGDPLLVQEEQNQRLVERMLNGGLGGLSSAVGMVATMNEAFQGGELRDAESPSFSIPGEVEVTTSPTHIFTEPTRLWAAGIEAETFGLATTTIKYRKNGVQQNVLDVFVLTANEKFELRYLFGQYLVFQPGETLSLEVTTPGAHENISVKFAGTQSI